MFYMPSIDNYLTVLTDEEVKYFAAINFNKYFKSIMENKIIEMLLDYFVSI